MAWLIGTLIVFVGAVVYLGVELFLAKKSADDTYEGFPPKE